MMFSGDARRDARGQRGDFTVRVPVRRGQGLATELAEAFNALVQRTEALTHEMVRVERVVGREGRMIERASLGGAEGDGRRALAPSMRSSATSCSRPPR